MPGYYRLTDGAIGGCWNKIRAGEDVMRAILKSLAEE